MTTPFVPSGAPAAESPKSNEPRLSPSALAILASVNTLRVQLDAMRAALDTIVALVHADDQTRAMIAAAGARRRATNEPARAGLPAIFGALPDGFRPSSLESAHDESHNPVNIGSDVLDRIDSTDASGNG